MRDFRSFEFRDGFCRYLITRAHPGQGLDPRRAASLLEQQLRHDFFFAERLARWFRGETFVSPFHDKQRLLQKLMDEVRSGWTRVLELESPRPVYSHQYSQHLPDVRDTPLPDEQEIFDDQELLDEHDQVDRDAAVFTIAEPDFVVEFADVHFATNRAILLPLPEDPDATSDTPRAAPLHVMAAVLEFAADHPERRIVVYGHADTAGKASHNDALSENRAINVQLYLAGEREAWAAHCQEHYEIADFKRVHRWAADRFGWSTDPGPLDNQWTSKARRARAEFRRRCDELLGTQLAQGVKQNPADWQAIFDLYEIAVADYLGCLPENVTSLRSAIAFAAPAAIGCGERWPMVGTLQDGVAEQFNRRSEIMFFQPGELPQAHGVESAPGDELYASGRYRHVRLAPVSTDEALLRITLLDEDGDPMPWANYEAETRVGPWSGTADGEGVATVPRALVDTEVVLQWTPADADTPTYARRHVLATGDGKSEWDYACAWRTSASTTWAASPTRSRTFSSSLAYRPRVASSTSPSSSTSGTRRAKNRPRTLSNTQISTLNPRWKLISTNTTTPEPR